jgi:hypothetical protein
LFLSYDTPATPAHAYRLGPVDAKMH